MPSPSIPPNPCTYLPYFYQETYLARIQKIYFVLLRVPKSLLVVFAKILMVVVVGNDNISPCRSEVGSRGPGSGDISSLASCRLRLYLSPSVLR